MTEKKYKDIIAVDENDNVIDTMNMMVAIKRGLLRRASRIYVFNESGQLLVQRRSKNVLKPLMLDQSCAGHVDAGETYLEAAQRELHEELGLSGYELEEVATSFRTTDFFNAVYKITITDDTAINFDQEELEAVIWYNLSDLDAEMKCSPEQFTPAFLEAWELLRDKLVT